MESNGEFPKENKYVSLRTRRTQVTEIARPEQEDRGKEAEESLSMGQAVDTVYQDVLFCRVVNISQENIAELRQSCTNFFKCNCLFSTVSPTIWTVGHIIPAHACDLFQKYNLGLRACLYGGEPAR